MSTAAAPSKAPTKEHGSWMENLVWLIVIPVAFLTLFVLYEVLVRPQFVSANAEGQTGTLSASSVAQPSSPEPQPEESQDFTAADEAEETPPEEEARPQEPAETQGDVPKPDECIKPLTGEEEEFKFSVLKKDNNSCGAVFFYNMPRSADGRALWERVNQENCGENHMPKKDWGTLEVDKTTVTWCIR